MKAHTRAVAWTFAASLLALTMSMCAPYPPYGAWGIEGVIWCALMIPDGEVLALIRYTLSTLFLAGSIGVAGHGLSRLVRNAPRRAITRDGLIASGMAIVALGCYVITNVLLLQHSLVVGKKELDDHNRRLLLVGLGSQCSLLQRTTLATARRRFLGSEG
jgi:hypothetical protein